MEISVKSAMDSLENLQTSDGHWVQKFEEMGLEVCQQVSLPAITAEDLQTIEADFDKTTRIRILKKLQEKIRSRYIQSILD